MSENSAVSELPPEQKTPANPFAEAKAEADKAKTEKTVTSLLSTVKTGKRKRPIFTIVYGRPGVGKSTFGSTAPFPVFIPTERGLDQLDVPKLPQVTEYNQLFDYIHTLRNEKHDYKTCVLDTCDGFEPLLWKQVCNEYQINSMESLKYGKAYNRAKELWREVLSELNALSEKMHVVALAHAHVRSFSDPMLDAPFDVWEMKMHAKSAEVLQESADNIFFAAIKVDLQKDNIKDKKGRGIVSEERVMYTQPATGFTAKNRFNLPAEMPLEWSALGTAVKEFYSK